MSEIDLDALVSRISARLITTEEAEPESEPVARLRAVSFQMGERWYAVRLAYTVEVLNEPRITRVPGLPPWVAGVTNLHGDVISVVNLGRFLLEQPARPGRALVMQAEPQRIGMIVDAVSQIMDVPETAILSPLGTVQPALIPYLHGIVEWDGHTVHLLDAEKLLHSDKMQQFGAAL